VALSKTSIAGASSLVAAAPFVIIGTLVSPTISDEAADQSSALASHRSAMILGQVLSNIALVLLIAGTIWLAVTIVSRSPKLAVAGGVLGVLGSLVVMFEAGVHATFASIVGNLDADQARTALERIGSSAAVKGLEPLSLLGDIGLLLLGIGAVRIGLPRWAAASLGVGALMEGAGFGSSTKALVVIGFVLVFVGAVMAVRAARAATRGPAPVGSPVAGTAATRVAV
jgi:uncharacterized membrane protein